MEISSSNLVLEGKQVLQMIESGKNLTILDCRFDLQDPSRGLKLFEESHIPTASYVDLEQDLSAEVTEHGGRHPLPSLAKLESMFQSKGVTNDHPVIVYDQGSGPFAARCFWILRFLGHPHVYILQGGWNEWVGQNYPIDARNENLNSGDFRIAPDMNMVATITDVRKAIESGIGVLIDSREYQRFLGNEESIDKKAGRIPTAHHYFWKDVFQDNRYQSSEQLKQHFQGLSETEPLIVYCGSGVTAAPNVVALYHAGFKHVKLYVGSFSDWISYDDSPISVGE